MEDGSQIINLPNDEYERIFGEISPKIKAIFSNVQKPKTNADRIRSMSDGELAQFLYKSFGCSINCPAYDTCDAQGACVEFLATWLKQEAET